MAKKNFLLLSLEDKEARKIANIIGNSSCKRILDHLSEKEATESELAEKLDIPISTVHYNLQQLMDANLVEVEEFHYSKKGKEMNHYKLANKYIIITPKKVWGIKEKLKGILPVALIAVGAAGFIQLFSKYVPETASQAKLAEPVERALAVAEAADVIPVVTEKATVLPQNIALWFLLGAIFTLIIYLLWTRKKDL